MDAAFLQGTVHTAAADMRAAIEDDSTTLALWQGLTPLGRNEFICWVEDAKKLETRRRRIERTGEGLREGKRRPCCWAGCVHRPDKPPGPARKAITIRREGKRGA